MRYMFDPFCVASSLEVSAEVTEKGRGTKYRSNVTFPLVTNTVTFLVDKEMRGTFKPGLSYNIKVKDYVAIMYWILDFIHRVLRILMPIINII